MPAPESGNRPRLFVALPMPERIKTTLGSLAADFPELKFATNFHLTLSFIGDALVPDECAETLREIQEAPFSLKLAGLGLFPQGILWAAPRFSPELVALKLAIDRALIKVGYAPEARDYRPHITLCRLRKSPSPELKERVRSAALDLEWKVDAFRLYESVLSPRGAIHKSLDTYPLRGEN